MNASSSTSPRRPNRRHFLQVAAASGMVTGLANRGGALAPPRLQRPAMSVPALTGADVGSLFPFIEKQAVQGEFPMSFLNSRYRGVGEWATAARTKVLDLLHKKFGELIPRETLMDEVWIKEGVITGRSLDMFVSKLRKKLSPDPELRITNVHGKGYKLEIPG